MSADKANGKNHNGHRAQGTGHRQNQLFQAWSLSAFGKSKICKQMEFHIDGLSNAETRNLMMNRTHKRDLILNIETQ